MQSNKLNFLKNVAFLLIVSILASGCTHASRSGNVYSRDEARKASKVHYGTIVNLADVQLQDDTSLLGALGGAVVGGVLGSTMGRGVGNTLVTLGGAVVGALAGNETEKFLGTKNAVEVRVKLDNGEVLSIVQQLGDIERNFSVGQKVVVTRSSDGSARVLPL